jgi:L-iditol 2-dehydrogenase
VRAAVLKGIKQVQIEERPVPEPKRGEARVRVTSVGVCGSDVHYYAQGKIGDQVIEGDHVCGHEFAGVVDKLGPDTDGPAPGTRVAVEPSINCGTCEQCESGHPNTCPNVIFYGTPPVQGAYTEYVCHPVHLMFPVPDEVSNDDAAMLEPLGIGIHSARRARIDLGETVAILGCGPIGLVTLMSARARGASRIIATDLHEYRLDVAKKLGADDVMVAGKGGDVVKWIMDLTDGRGVDATFDCAGEQETINEALDGARIGGRAVLVGIPRLDRISYDPHPARRKELDVLNIRRSRFTVEAGLAMAKAKQVDLRSMVTHTFALEQIKDAFEIVDTYSDGVVKAVIRVSES